MASVGEMSLSTLLASMDPQLHDPTYVFLTFPPSFPPPQDLPATLTFAELEGTTVITSSVTAAAHDLSAQAHFPSRMITLNIHSSLEAVGFLAVITRELAARGVPCNAVSAFYHDHLFVPVGREDEAMEVLRGIVEGAKRDVQAAS